MSRLVHNYLSNVVPLKGVVDAIFAYCDQTSKACWSRNYGYFNAAAFAGYEQIIFEDYKSQISTVCVSKYVCVWAAGSGNLPLLKWLVKKKGETEEIKSWSSSFSKSTFHPLLFAAAHSKMKSVDWIASHTNSIEMKQYSFIILMFAAANEEFEYLRKNLHVGSIDVLRTFSVVIGLTMKTGNGVPDEEERSLFLSWFLEVCDSNGVVSNARRILGTAAFYGFWKLHLQIFEYLKSRMELTKLATETVILFRYGTEKEIKKFTDFFQKNWPREEFVLADEIMVLAATNTYRSVLLPLVSKLFGRPVPQRLAAVHAIADGDFSNARDFYINIFKEFNPVEIFVSSVVTTKGKLRCAEWLCAAVQEDRKCLPKLENFFVHLLNHKKTSKEEILKVRKMATNAGHWKFLCERTSALKKHIVWRDAWEDLLDDSLLQLFLDEEDVLFAARNRNLAVLRKLKKLVPVSLQTLKKIPLEWEKGEENEFKREEERLIRSYSTTDYVRQANF